MKILIVDDHVGMRRVIRKTCAGLADQFIESASGEEAIEAFQEHVPDWVIMDLRMPVMDGFAATTAILQNAPGAKIIITTQLQGADLREQSLKIGAVEFVNKQEMSRLPEILRNTPSMG